MKILISGYYGFGNAGDEAVLKVLLAGFQAHTVTVISASDRNNWLWIIKAIKNCDVFISGGGTLFQNATSNRSLFYYLFLVKLAWLCRKKIVVFGQGFGPVKGFFPRFCTRILLNKAHLIMLRDRVSFNEVYKLGVKKPALCLTADPTGVLHVPKPRVGHEILMSEKIKVHGSLVGLVLRKLPLDKARLMADVISWLRGKHGFTPVFIPFQPAHDLEFCAEVMHMAGISSKLILRHSNPEELLAVFSQLDLVIGMRLHSLIFSLLNKVPMLGLSYDPKVAAFMDWLNQPFIDIRALDLKEVQLRIEEILANKHLIRRQLEELAPLFQRKAALNFDLFFEGTCE